MKKTFIIILTFFVVVLLSSCGAKVNFWDSLNMIDYSKIEEYTSTSEILGMFSRALSINDIVDEDTYIYKGNTQSYAIFKTKNSANNIYYLFLLYNNEDSLIYDTIYTDKFYNKELFETSNSYIGISAENFYKYIGKDVAFSGVKEEIIFLNSNEYVYVNYDNDYRIRSIEKYIDSLNFYSILADSEDFDISDLNANKSTDTRENRKQFSVLTK